MIYLLGDNKDCEIIFNHLKVLNKLFKKTNSRYPNHQDFHNWAVCLDSLKLLSRPTKDELLKATVLNSHTFYISNKHKDKRSDLKKLKKFSDSERGGYPLVQFKVDNNHEQIATEICQYCINLYTPVNPDYTLEKDINLSKIMTGKLRLLEMDDARRAIRAIRKKIMLGGHYLIDHYNITIDGYDFKHLSSNCIGSIVLFLRPFYSSVEIINEKFNITNSVLGNYKKAMAIENFYYEIPPNEKRVNLMKKRLKGLLIGD